MTVNTSHTVTIAVVLALAALVAWDQRPEPVSAPLRAEAVATCAPRHPLPPAPFTTDGCSLFPDGWWKSCCITHDIPYWCGGTRAERSEADKELTRCVNRFVPGLGSLTLVTRLSGHPLLPFPWRWGYGYPWPRSYERMND